MSGIAGAIAGAAVLGAGATIATGAMSSGAISSAANTAANEQQYALQQAEQQAAPYTQLGQSAIPQLQSLLGLTQPGGTPGAGNAAALTTLQNTPGYQFALQQGLAGVTANQAATGTLGSGNTLAALDQYGTGLADQTYEQQVANLQNVVNTGQGAAAGVASNIEQTGTNLSNIATSAGQDQANIDANMGASLARLAGGSINAATSRSTLADLANPAGGGALSGGISDSAGTIVPGLTGP